MEISVALCSFNGAKFLSDQLDSIASQTRKPDEVVVCDDGSSDETLALLHSFGERCSFSVHVYSNTSRLGSIKNFEKAIEACKGDIIVLADQDDVWDPEKLALMEDAFEKNPGAGYLFSDASLVDAEGRLLGHSLWATLGFNKTLIGRFENGEQLHCLFRKPIVTGATMAIRASLKQFVLPIPANTIFVHDLWIALVASSINMPGLPLSDRLIRYRLHSSQQIGVRRPTLLALYKDVVGYDKNNLLQFSYAFKCLADRLAVISDERKLELNSSMELINEKIGHLNTRFAIHTDKTRRFKLITREVLSGRYKSYSDSWKSVLRDLLATRL